MCTTYVFQDPKTGNHLKVWESWGPLEPSDTVPDVAGRKTSFSKMTRTLNMVPAPVPRRARGTRCGGSTVRIARRPCKATGCADSPHCQTHGGLQRRLGHGHANHPPIFVATPRGRPPQRAGRSWLATDYPARIEQKRGGLEVIAEVLQAAVGGLLAELLIRLLDYLARVLKRRVYKPKHMKR